MFRKNPYLETTLFRSSWHKIESRLFSRSNLELPKHQPTRLFLFFLGSYVMKTPLVLVPKSRDLSVWHKMAESLDITLISSTNSISVRAWSIWVSKTENTLQWKYFSIIQKHNILEKVLQIFIFHNTTYYIHLKGYSKYSINSILEWNVVFDNFILIFHQPTNKFKLDYKLTKQSNNRNKN